jgi:hypothetical protein
MQNIASTHWSLASGMDWDGKTSPKLELLDWDGINLK